MTNLANLQAIVTDANVQSWISNFLSSKANTYFRSDAVSGLRGAVVLAVGAEKNVAVTVASPLRNSAIVVDGESFRIGFSH